MKHIDASKKSRYFAFVVYKDNGLIQEDGKDPREVLIKKLRDTFGDYAVSPLHESDEDENNDHYHVVYYHGNTVSLKAVRDMFDRFNTQIFGGLTNKTLIKNNFIVPLHHPRNYQRYLVHLDQPEKQQFDMNEDDDLIAVVNNFPLDLTRELTHADKMRIQREIEVIIEEYSLHEYWKVSKYLRTNQDLTDHYEYFTSHTMHFSRFIDSMRNFDVINSNKKTEEQQD